jgi:hypothetical protein
MPRFELCPACGNPVLIREDGTVSTHMEPRLVLADTPDSPLYCVGSDRVYINQHPEDIPEEGAA